MRGNTGLTIYARHGSPEPRGARALQLQDTSQLRELATLPIGQAPAPAMGFNYKSNWIVATISLVVDDRLSVYFGLGFLLALLSSSSTPFGPRPAFAQTVRGNTLTY